jgi:diguanylate cyclase (GGDEF)-like protein
MPGEYAGATPPRCGARVAGTSRCPLRCGVLQPVPSPTLTRISGVGLLGWFDTASFKWHGAIWPGLRGETMRVSWSRWGFLSLAAALVALAGIGDYVSDYEVAFTLIYLAPVALATWKVGRGSGMLVAVAAALCSVLSNLGHVPPIPVAVQFWNLATELGVFATMAALLASLKGRLQLESERALTDVLTGLKNRRAFQEGALAEIERARRHGRPLTVALRDLDGFKQLNDTLGHDAGDEALTTVGDVLLRRLRVLDVVGRLGGDEFALLLPETAAAEAVTVFRDLLAQIPSRLQERGWPVGVSLGAVTFNSAPQTLDDALREADTLLYQAKRAGKGQLRHETSPSRP